MEPPEDISATLFAAGADALRFNAPLGADRADRLVRFLSGQGVTSVVDLGCGRGELAALMAAGTAGASVVGVETDERLVRAAGELAAAGDLGDRLRIEHGDAAIWSGVVDGAIGVGVSHVFGGPAEMMARLAVLVPAGAAVVGDAVWDRTPTDWCRQTFGDLPDGAETLATVATDAGWTVTGIDRSTLDEWDRFEHGWIGGVRSVGTEEAAALADQREREYQEYRGVLGFCWLLLSR